MDFRYAPVSSWTAICRPGERGKTLVREDGALLYGFRSRHWLCWYFDRVIEFGLAGGERPLSVEQSTETAADAIVVTTLRYPAATLQLRAFRHVLGGRGFDVVQWSIGVAADVDELLTGLHIDIYDRGPGFVSGRRGAADVVYEGEDRVAWWYDTRGSGAPDEPAGARVVLQSTKQPLAPTHPSGFRPAAGFATAPDVVRGGERSTGAIVVALDGARVVGLSDEWSADALGEARAFWKGLFPAGLPISVPDRGVQELLEASARNLLQASEPREGVLAFQVGHALYRGLWMADGYFILEAARYLGFDEDVDRAVEALRQYVRTDGSIVIITHEQHVKETGIALATIVRQCQLANDKEALRSWWPVIERAVGYIETLRESARRLPAEDPAHGLFPASFGDGGVAGVRAEYTTALWMLAGLKAVVDGARWLDLEPPRRAFDGLLADFRAHAARNMRALPDGNLYLPIVLDGDHHTIPELPATSPEVHIRPETATWALAQAIWPGEVFAPDDPIVTNFLHLLDLRDDEEDVPATTGWLPYRALWTYYASFAAHAWLYAGHAEKAISYLYGFANHAAPTRVWREEQPLRGAGHGQINGDMPHNWASAEFIRLVRHLLVFERRGELHLLPAVPESWLTAGGEIRLDHAPTRFGPVDLRVRCERAGGVVSVGLPDGNGPSLGCVLHVPAGRWRIEQSAAEPRTVSGPAVVTLRCS